MDDDVNDNAHADATAAFATRLMKILVTPRLDQLVAAYFDSDGPFAGATFDELGVNPPAAISSDDLLAVTLLDVRWQPPAVRQLLETKAELFTRLLGKIGDDIDLWLADTSALRAAGKLWDELRALSGVDWVIAGKLLARKRSRMIPIADSVIIGALCPPHRRFWMTLQHCLKDDDVRGHIERLRPTDVARDTSLIRLLDVAVWMLHSRSRNAEGARREAGIGQAGLKDFGP